MRAKNQLPAKPQTLNDENAIIEALNDPIERELAICYRNRVAGSVVGLPYALWARLALHRHAYDQNNQVVRMGGPAGGSSIDMFKYPDAIAVDIGEWNSCATINWGSLLVWFYPKL